MFKVIHSLLKPVKTLTAKATASVIFSLVLMTDLSGCGSLGQMADTGLQISQASGFNPTQLTNGVKDVLELSAIRATDTLSVSGAYGDSQLMRIGLPESVQSITGKMRQFGLGGYIDNVEMLMNRGAEKAAAEAKPMLISAIKAMSVSDAIGIVRGGDTAATRYFREQTESSVAERYRDIMQSQLKQLGFYGDYQQLLNAYKLVPIANKPSLDLEQHAVNLGLNALYSQIAEEEKKIRANPVEQGSVLIGAIFSR